MSHSLAHFRPRHVIWDWNGTLIDDVALSVQGLCTTLIERGMEPLSIEQYRDTVRHPVKEWLLEIGVTFDSEEEVHRMSRRYHDFYMAGRSACSLHDDARSLLEELRTAGVENSILSAHPQSFVESGLRHFEIDENFKYVFGASDQLGKGKIVEGQALLKKIGVSRDSVILVGDMDHDCEVARALGVECILVSHGLQSHRRLEACGVTVVKNLSEVRNALLTRLPNALNG